MFSFLRRNLSQDLVPAKSIPSKACVQSVLHRPPASASLGCLSEMQGLLNHNLHFNTHTPPPSDSYGWLSQFEKRTPCTQASQVWAGKVCGTCTFAPFVESVGGAVGSASPCGCPAGGFHRVVCFCHEQGTDHPSAPRVFQRMAKEETVREEGAFICEREQGAVGGGRPQVLAGPLGRCPVAVVPIHPGTSASPWHCWPRSM